MDVARTALRSGATEVIVAYRRTGEKMPASKEYIKDALREGGVVCRGRCGNRSWYGSACCCHRAERTASAIDRYLGYSGEIHETLLPTSCYITPSSIGDIEGCKNRQLIDATQVNDVPQETKRCLWCDLVTGNPEHPLSKDWSCRRGRAHTARRMYELWRTGNVINIYYYHVPLSNKTHLSRLHEVYIQLY